jgi:hypothetical protein
VRASATGTCDFHGDGSWNFKLAGLSVDRLSLDPELVSALPGRVRRPLADLKLSGPCNLRGTLEFQSGGRPSDLIRSGWNVQAGFQRGSIDCGGKLDNICGEVSLVGGFDGQTMQCRGELDDVYLTCHDVQLAQLRGPFWLDDQQVLLGTWVDRPSQATPRADPSAAGRKPRSLTAKLWNGTLFADGWIDQHRSPPHFSLKATLVQADLRRCAQETMSAHQDLEGKICADLTLHGAGRSIGSLGGSGTIQLREANIYEVPQMIRLLKILSFRPPDAKDFSQSDIDFKIADNHVYFDRIDFRGDAISLLGKGEMTFDSRLGLTFHAMIGRGEWHLPVFHEILGRASEQIMLIHVGGTLQEPQMRREALPQVNQVLQMFQGSDAPASVPEFHPQAK